MSGSGYVQDRVVAVYGEAIHAETVATGRVCERQHIADPLARLTSHVRCSGMYGQCPETMSLSNAPGPERPPVAPRRAPASPRSTVAERAWTCRLWPVAEASPLSNAAARKDCTKHMKCAAGKQYKNTLTIASEFAGSFACIHITYQFYSCA